VGGGRGEVTDWLNYLFTSPGEFERH
jgi:hypothetical protein